MPIVSKIEFVDEGLWESKKAEVAAAIASDTENAWGPHYWPPAQYEVDESEQPIARRLTCDNDSTVKAVMVDCDTLVCDRCGKEIRAGMNGTSEIAFELREEQEGPMTDLICWKCERELEAPRWYVAVYLCDRAYGGPEEGGWWYGTRELRDFRVTSYPNEVDAMVKQMEELWSNEGRRSISSVASEGEYRVMVSRARPVEFEPTERPHYE